jgi:hypothetical protein
VRVPRFRRRLAPLTVTLAAALIVVTVAVAASPDARRAWYDLVGTATQPVVSEPTDQVIIVLRAAPAALRLGATSSNAAAVAARVAQDRGLRLLARRGIRITPTMRFTLVINAVVATVTSRQRVALISDPAVAGVYPNRVLLPASISTTALDTLGASVRPVSTPLAGGGGGVTVALLDGPVDTTQPMISGRVVQAAATVAPPAAAQAHATAIASIITGSGGPAGLTGVAPAARLVSDPVMAANPDGSLSGTTATLLRGFEQAADPNGDGNLNDHARVVVAAVSAPFDGFADSAESRAVNALSQLGSVVVAAAGNDGATGGRYGTLGSPAAAADALTVGAVDGRTALPQEALTFSGAVAGTLNAVPIVGAFAATAGLRLDLVAPQPVASPFGAQTTLAGKAVLLERGGNLAARIREAAASGAACVIVTGDASPAAGALGADDQAPLPVLALAGVSATQVAAAVSVGQPVSVTFGAASYAPNPQAGMVAPFSSTGLGYADTLKPDVVLAGVAVIAGQPQAQYAAVTGTSVAAAQAAGLVAVLAARHPDWSSSEIRSTLVSTGRLVVATAGAAAVEAQGGGEPDASRADSAPLATSPVTLSFGQYTTSTTRRRVLRVTNLAATPVTVTLGFQHDDAPDPLIVGAQTPRFLLAAHQTRSVTVSLRIVNPRVTPGVVGGWLVLQTTGGVAQRVPFAAATDAAPAMPIRVARLTATRIRRGASATLVLGLGTAARLPDGTLRIVAVSRLVIDLDGPRGRVGRLYAASDLLPGRYAFLVRPVDPQMVALAPGSYRLVVTASGVDGATTRRVVPFVVAGP